MTILNRVLISTLLAAAAVPAGAVTWTASFGNVPPVGPGESTIANFDTDSTFPAGYTLGGEYRITSGTTTAAAAPAGDTSKYFYTSPAIPSGSGIATLSTALDLYSISFYWGSVDDYNAVDVLGADGVTLETITGKQFSAANGNQTAPDTNQRIYIKVDTGEAITGLRFHATGIAFEIDDVAGRLLTDGAPSTVPEPATWGLMIGGFAMVGIGARRRRYTARRVAA